MKFFNSCPLLLIGISSASCATLPADYARPTSTAFQGYLDTSAGEIFEAAAVQHPDESEFAIIRYGRQAFTARWWLTYYPISSADDPMEIKFLRKIFLGKLWKSGESFERNSMYR